MIPLEAWQAFGGFLAVLILLGSAAMALRRLGILKSGNATLADEDVRGRVAELERDQAALRLHVSEHYLRRDDWVATSSRIMGTLEDHTVMLVRLDERFRAAERIWNGQETS